MAVYDLGDVVALGITITDANGAPANATAVVATVTLPDGSTTTPTVVNSATGLYDINYTPSQVGRYTIRWVATGTNASAYADEFSVRDYTKMGIVSLDEVKQHLNIPSTTTALDEELRRFAYRVQVEQVAQVVVALAALRVAKQEPQELQTLVAAAVVEQTTLLQMVEQAVLV